MRAFGGLVALLVTVALILWLWTEHTTVVVEKSKPAIETANQLSGHDREGRGIKASDGIKLEGMFQAGKLRSLIVAEISDDNPLATFYGLKRGDCIVQAGSFDFRDEDEKLAIPMVFQEGYQKQLPLIVMRDGEKISLPLPRTSTPPEQAQPQKPPADKNSGSSLQRQIDAIPGVR
ncbi:MAG: hypothetical protein ABSH20_19670 [Tepidisphaeraceae bacterium]|jgi:hypothetical protein